MTAARLRTGTVAAVLLVVAGVAPALAAGPSSATAPPSGTVSWQSAGDSYSSGEGVFGNIGDCAQSDQAYGPRAAAKLKEQGWKLSSLTFTACTGHLVEDYFNPRSDSGGKDSLWQWGRAQGGPARVDVITMSFGGNDVGFAEILTDCLDLPENWHHITGLVPSGCDPAEADLNERIDALADPPRSCRATRRTGDGFDCDLDLGDHRGSIVDFYTDVVKDRLTEHGQLVVVGYPRIFAPVDQWPGWVKTYCQGVSRGDTEKLGRLTERLNGVLSAAIGRANDELGAERVHFVDRLASYRDGKHELCGTNDDWLNGIAMDRGEGLGARKETSFHPNAAGHAGTTDQVVDLVGGLAADLRPAPPTTPPVDLDSPPAVAAEFIRRAINGGDVRSLVLPIEIINGEGETRPVDPGILAKEAESLRSYRQDGRAIVAGDGGGFFTPADQVPVGEGCGYLGDFHIGCHVLYMSTTGRGAAVEFYVSLSGYEGKDLVDSFSLWEDFLN